MALRDYHIGYTGTYIQDHTAFHHLCEIPEEVAVAWVKKDFPETMMGCGTLGKELTVNTFANTDAGVNGWMNKMFILVANEHGKWVALVKWDFKFHIYVER